HLRALLDDADGELDVALGRELPEPTGRGEPGGTGADDHDGERHRLARGVARFAVCTVAAISRIARHRLLARKNCRPRAVRRPRIVTSRPGPVLTTGSYKAP